MSLEVIKNTKAFVRAQLGTEGTGHDYWHAHRVDKTAVGIHAYEGGDRLDAMGAIGIARAFAFGGSRGRLLYDPEYTAQKFESSEAYKNAQSSTLHHFDEKLFLLKDLMNTERGRELAEERDAYMHAFVERFMEEWAGNQ